MLQNLRDLTYRPSREPALVSPLTVRSTGHYRFVEGEECNVPRPFTQLFWVDAGQFEFLKEHVWVEVSADSRFFYTAMTPHHVRAKGTGGSYYWVTFDGPLIGNWLERTVGNRLPLKSGPCPVHLFENLKACLSTSSIHAERKAAEIGLAILLEAADETGSRHGKDTQGEQLCRAMERLADMHFRNPDFGISDIVEELGCHRATLYRNYQIHRGMKPSAYLQRVRLQNAIDSLKNGNGNITEVALASGYRDANYFAKVVRRHTGESPSAFQGFTKSDFSSW